MKIAVGFMCMTTLNVVTTYAFVEVVIPVETWTSSDEEVESLTDVDVNIVIQGSWKLNAAVSANEETPTPWSHKFDKEEVSAVELVDLLVENVTEESHEPTDGDSRKEDDREEVKAVYLGDSDQDTIRENWGVRDSNVHINQTIKALISNQIEDDIVKVRCEVWDNLTLIYDIPFIVIQPLSDKVWKVEQIDYETTYFMCFCVWGRYELSHVLYEDSRDLTPESYWELDKDGLREFIASRNEFVLVQSWHPTKEG